MSVLNQWKHSKSINWVDWKRSKSETIHLLRKWTGLEIINQNHSTYWIVYHWNPFKLVNIVSVIMLANLNWGIYHNYNPFKLERLVVIHAIFIHTPLWYDVLIWYWICEWLDLPNLQSITLGDNAFRDSMSTVIVSIEWIWMNWLIRSSILTINSFGACSYWWERWILFLFLKTKEYWPKDLKWLNVDLPQLRTIVNSEGCSFNEVRSITFHSNVASPFHYE